MFLYLDESGDLGWKFDAPYRFGGSSRHLTIASLVITPEKRHLPKRLIQKLYKKFNWRADLEKKWSDMTTEERRWFVEEAIQLHARNAGDIRYISITVKKDNVQDLFRKSPNILYNYMIGLSLLREINTFDVVTFYPDARSVKVESGNSLHDYLQTQLWFEMNSRTILTTIPTDSASNRNVQFADMLSGVVQGHFEDGKSDPWSKLEPSLNSKRLFF